jgi:mannosyltransferase
MLAVLATLLLYRGLADPRPGRWVGYGVTVVLLGASHLVALTVLGAHAVVLLRQSGGKQHHPRRAWLLTVAAALACLAPLAYLGAGQRDAQLSWVPPLTAHALAATPASVVGSADTGWLLVGLALLAARRRAELAALALVPVAAVAAYSVIADPLWVPRYLLIVLAPLALAAAVGAADRAGLARLVVVLLVLAGTAYPEQRRVREVAAHNGGNYRQAAQLIARLDQPGDAIVFQNGRSTRAGIDYYLRNEPDRPSDVLLDRSAAAVDSLTATERTDVAARLGGARRVWLVVMGRPADPLTAKPSVRPVLANGFTRTGLWRFSRTTVALYRHP